jgi:hypothetical protein
MAQNIEYKSEIEIDDRAEEGVNHCVFHLPVPVQQSNRGLISHGFFRVASLEVGSLL